MASGQRLVVMAVDPSEHSEYAFNWYLDNFYFPETKLYLVTVPEYNISADYETSPGRIEAELKEIHAKTGILKAKYVNKMSERGVNGEFVVLEGGRPGHAIVEFAHTKGAAMIVTGTRCLTKIKRTFLGSVSDFIIHHADIPVLVCRHK